MTRIFLDHALSVDSEIEIDGDTAHRLDKVLRVKRDEQIYLFNGSGGEYTATILSITRKTARIRIHQFDPIERESPLDTALIQGLSRGPRMDYTLQKAVELGIKAIYPVATQRTVVQLDDARRASRHTHWSGVIQHAAEQSGRTRIPELAPLSTLEALGDRSLLHGAFFLDTQSAVALAESLRPPARCAIVAGPEGGFDDAERALIVERGAIAIRLGPRILRTETAALTALSIMQAWWGDLC